jgi:hypothetical protein
MTALQCSVSTCRLTKTQSMAETRKRELAQAVQSGRAELARMQAALQSHHRYIAAALPQLQAEHARFEGLWRSLGLAGTQALPPGAPPLLHAETAPTERWQASLVPEPLLILGEQAPQVCRYLVL